MTAGKLLLLYASCSSSLKMVLSLEYCDSEKTVISSLIPQMKKTEFNITLLERRKEKRPEN